MADPTPSPAPYPSTGNGVPSSWSCVDHTPDPSATPAVLGGSDCAVTSWQPTRAEPVVTSSSSSSTTTACASTTASPSDAACSSAADLHRGLVYGIPALALVVLLL